MKDLVKVMLISGKPERFSADFHALQIPNASLLIVPHVEAAFAMQTTQEPDLIIADQCSLNCADEDLARHFGVYNSPLMQQLVVVLPFLDQDRIVKCLNLGINQCLVSPVVPSVLMGLINRLNRSSRQSLINGAFYKSFPDENPYPVCRIDNEFLQISYANPVFYSSLYKLQRHQQNKLISLLEQGVLKYRHQMQVRYEYLELGKKRYQVTFAVQAMYTNVYFSDLTALKQVEEEMSEKEVLHKTILDNIPADLGVFDNQMRYLFVNPKGIKNPEIRQWIIGKTDEDYIALRQPANLEPFERRKKAFKQAIDEKRTVVWLDDYTNEHGVTYMRRTVHPVFDENGELQLLIGYGNDITDLILAENGMKNLTTELTLQNEGLRRYAYIISHDLRAPTINLKTLLELYREDDPGHPKNAEVIKRLKISADRIHDTLSDLLEVTRIKEKAQAEPKAQCNIREIWLNCLADQASQLQSISAQVQESFCNDDIVYFNRIVLNSVFNNMISNAIKYRSAERPLQLHMRTVRKEKSYEIHITDNGIGLDVAKYRNRIFSLYQRFHTHVEGKGLGLFLVRSQLESLGSTLSIQSKVDEGSTFTIAIPIS